MGCRGPFTEPFKGYRSILGPCLDALEHGCRMIHAGTFFFFFFFFSVFLWFEVRGLSCSDFLASTVSKAPTAILLHTAGADLGHKSSDD